MFAGRRGRDFRGAGEKSAEMKRSEELEAERGLAGGEEAIAEGQRLATGGSNDDRGTFALPRLLAGAVKPACNSTLPRCFRRGGDQRARAASGLEFEFELHPPILAEGTDKDCPRPREKVNGINFPAAARVWR